MDLMTQINPPKEPVNRVIDIEQLNKTEDCSRDI